MKLEDVPAELADALADRMFDDAHEGCDEECHGTPRSYYDEYARALLAETILPAHEHQVRAAVAAEIEAERSGGTEHWHIAMDHAARIARGESR